MNCSPEQAEILRRANILAELGQLDNAINLLREVLREHPDFRDAHIQLGYNLCKQEKYEHGARELSWIWMPIFGNQENILDQSLVKDKIVLVCSDAGLGDAIMFSRYLINLKIRNPRKIILQVPPPLVRLMKLSNLADSVISTNDPLPINDVIIPFHNIMIATKIFPSSKDFVNESYLKYDSAEKENKSKYLSYMGHRRVGICWGGNKNFKHDRERSVSIKQLLKYCRMDDQLISLCPDRNDEIELPILSYHFDDIAETAALISNLDLVVTVDTMVCHLSGALGIPTLLLNRFSGCWRWGNRQSRSLWYPSVSIINQNHDRSWPNSQIE